MGQAKKELAEQEAKLARKDKYLEKKGYNKCVECQEMFIPKDGEIICGDCWEKKVADQDKKKLVFNSFQNLPKIFEITKINTSQITRKIQVYLLLN
ncbi:TPA: hypothetical protein J0S99_003081 [Enterococcus faecium]|nr:hypothetical protein [Enterococcus faecium]HAZ0589066.1 hypothetical protein [Enterococcus faecium]